MMKVATAQDQTTDHQKTALLMPELRWQCRRGMLELDILLNGFLETQYAQLDTVQRESFITLLTYPDQTLYELLMNKMASSNPAIAEIVSNIRSSATFQV